MLLCLFYNTSHTSKPQIDTKQIGGVIRSGKRVGVKSVGAVVDVVVAVVGLIFLAVPR